MKKDVYLLSELIEVESINLNVLVCDKGYNFESLSEHLTKILSLIKSAQNLIISKQESLNHHGH